MDTLSDDIRGLAENPYADDADNLARLTDLISTATPLMRELWENVARLMWTDLRERVEWRDAVTDGAYLDPDDDGRLQDRETVLEDVERDIAALIDSLCALADRPAVAA